MLAGTPVLRTPGGERDLAEGEVVAFPVGEEGAHQVVNRGSEPPGSSGQRDERARCRDAPRVGQAQRLRPPAGHQRRRHARGIYFRRDTTDLWDGEVRRLPLRRRVTVSRLGVAGAGTMGAGIAQLGVLGGLQTTLYDPIRRRWNVESAAYARRSPRAWQRGAGPRRRPTPRRARLPPSPSSPGSEDCELVVEAAPEDLELKRSLLISLAGACGDDAVLATNTSSLAVGAIAEPVPRPARVCGLHFFNPPALMRLVEIVAAEQTDPATVETAESAARAMGRDAVRCTDSPGFIVNRCNRPFTLESLRIVGSRHEWSK